MPPLFRDEEAREWLAIAARDLRVSELALGDSPPLIREALYHAQQAAEKALKAFLIWHGRPYPRTHDIHRLLDLCTPIDASLDQALSDAVDLTEFAVRFRYPGEDQPAPEEARVWLETARRVVAEVRRRIGPKHE